jgi:hypothetical protein
MANVDQLINELHSLAQLVALRHKAENASESDPVSNDIVKSYVAKVASCKNFDSPSAIKLITALEAAKIPRMFHTNIETAVYARLSGAACIAQHSAAHGGGKTQKLLGQIVNYLTAGDWAMLYKPSATWSSMTQVLVNALLKVGVVHLDEQTVKWAVSILLHVHCDVGGQFPTYQSVYNVVGDFKTQHSCCKKPYPHDTIWEYPESPTDLPKPIFEYAYSADDPPTVKTLDRLSNIAQHHVPLRKSSKLLKKEAAAAMTREVQPHAAQQLAMCGPSLGQQTVTWDHLLAFVTDGNHRASNRPSALQQLQRGHSNIMDDGERFSAGTSSSNGDGSSANRTPPPKAPIQQDTPPPKSPLALCDGDNAGQDTMNAAELLRERQSCNMNDRLRAGDAQAPSAEDFESEAFDALKKRNATRKQESNDKKRRTDAAGPVEDEGNEDDDNSDIPHTKKPAAKQVVAQRKPAAAVPPVMKTPAASVKKPAAAVPPVKYSKEVLDKIHVKWNVPDSRKSRESYTSTVSHSATNAARRAGMEESLCKAAGRTAYANAVALWNKHNK